MLELKHISKRYNDQKVLKDLSMTLPDCGLISIVGESGCGKSTLLHIIGGILKEYSGEVLYHGNDIKAYRTHYKKHVSFIFQDIYLIMWMNILNNISLSRYFYKGKFNIEVLKNDYQVLKMAHLSFGQRQNIAYLRTLYTHSDIVLCDEPTGSLDPQSAKQLMEELKKISKTSLVVMVSHDEELVNEYSDEIYYISDGEISAHTIINTHQKRTDYTLDTPAYPFSTLKLAFYNMLTHKKQNIIAMISLVITLFCIMLTFTLSQGLEKEIYEYIYSLVPINGISFQHIDHSSIEEEEIIELINDEDIIRCQLFLKNYEFLGIGFNSERYKESETLFISDDSSSYDYIPLSYGVYPKEDHEIILSLSTAMKLSDNVESLINQKVYAWYKHDLKVIPIEYKIVGISDQKTSTDTLYQCPNAYIHLLKENYAEYNDFDTYMGLLYARPDKDRDELYTKVSKLYKDIEFKKVGESTFEHVQSVMDKVEAVIFCLTILCILSSLMLIGELMYLHMTKDKKDYMIMTCFGASRYHIIMIMVYMVSVLFLISFIMSLSLYAGTLQIINNVVKTVLFNDTLHFSIDINVINKTLILGLILMILAFIPSFISITHSLDVNDLKNS